MAPENLIAYHKFLENQSLGVKQSHPLKYFNPRKCDIFSIGMIMIRCVIPKAYPESYRTVLNDLNKDEMSFKRYFNDVSPFLPEDLIDVLRNMTSFNPSIRPSIEQIWELINNQQTNKPCLAKTQSTASSHLKSPNGGSTIKSRNISPSKGFTILVFFFNTRYREEIKKIYVFIVKYSR